MIDFEINKPCYFYPENISLEDRDKYSYLWQFDNQRDPVIGYRVSNIWTTPGTSKTVILTVIDINNPGLKTIYTNTYNVGLRDLTVPKSVTYGTAFTLTTNTEPVVGLLDTYTAGYGDSIIITPHLPVGATGTIDYYIGSTLTLTVSVSGGGTADPFVLTNLLHGGTNIIHAHFNSTSGIFTSLDSNTITQRITKITPTIHLLDSQTVHLAGNVESFIVFIYKYGTSIPDLRVSGTVDIFNGSTLLDTIDIIAGQATLATTAIPVGGPYAITAVYNGDTNFNTTTSNTLTITVAYGGPIIPSETDYLSPILTTEGYTFIWTMIATTAGDALSYAWIETSIPITTVMEALPYTGAAICHTAAISKPITMMDNGKYLTCVVMNSYGIAISTSAQFSVTPASISAPTVVTSPSSVVWVADPLTFTAVFTGSFLTFQWQTKSVYDIAWNDTGMPTSSPDPYTSILNDISFSKPSLSGMKYRCIATNSAGSATTAEATMTVAGAAPLVVSITVTPSTYTLRGMFDNKQFTAIATYDDASTADVTNSCIWSSSSPYMVAITTSTIMSFTFINAPGLASCVGSGSGSATITAQIGTIIGTATCYFTGYAISYLTVSPIASSVAVGYSLTYTCIAHWTSGVSGDVSKTVGWNSNNSGIATIGGHYYGTVAGNPTAYGVHTGTVTITATTGLGIFFGTPITASTTLTVTSPSSGPVEEIGFLLSNIAVNETDTITITSIASHFSTTGDTLVYSWIESPVTITSLNLATYIGSPIATGPSLTKIATMTDNGKYLTCVVSNSYGTITTNSATITVTPVVLTAPIVVTNPIDKTYTTDPPDGSTFTLTAEFTGSALSYQWEQKGYYDSSWYNSIMPTINTSTTSILTENTFDKSSINGMQYRCTATNSGGSITTTVATLTVVALPLEIISIAISPSSYTLKGTNDSIRLTATATYVDSSTGDITASCIWSSSAPTVASVLTASLIISPNNPPGTVIALSGSADVTITATAGLINGIATIHTNGFILSSIEVTPSTHSLIVPATYAYTATATWSDSSTGDISNTIGWTSSNTSVAKIGSYSGGILRGNPTATAVSNGTITITATNAIVGFSGIVITGTATLTVGSSGSGAYRPTSGSGVSSYSRGVDTTGITIDSTTLSTRSAHSTSGPGVYDMSVVSDFTGFSSSSTPVNGKLWINCQAISHYATNLGFDDTILGDSTSSISIDYTYSGGGDNLLGLVGDGTQAEGDYLVTPELVGIDLSTLSVTITLSVHTENCASTTATMGLYDMVFIIG